MCTVNVIIKQVGVRGHPALGGLQVDCRYEVCVCVCLCLCFFRMLTGCFGLVRNQAAHKVRVSRSQVGHELPEVLLKNSNNTLIIRG